MKRNIIFFIGGAVIGALGGFFGAKTYYQKKYEEYANETVDAMKDVLYGTTKEEEEYEEDSVNPVVKTPEWTEEKQKETRERLERNRKGINYAAIYGNVKNNIGGNEDEETDSEDPEDPQDDDTEAEDAEPEVVARHERNKGRKPHIISLEKARDLPDGIDFVELQFYDDDQVLADSDTEERITDVETVLGDCLFKYDFANSDEPVIYVMNEELDTCYEVIRVMANYGETHPE